MTPRAMSPAEAAAFNEGVKLILDLASRTARKIEETSKRHLHEGFAIVALRELADAGTTLLIRSTVGQKEAA